MHRLMQNWLHCAPAVGGLLLLLFCTCGTTDAASEAPHPRLRCGVWINKHALHIYIDTTLAALRSCRWPAVCYCHSGTTGAAPEAPHPRQSKMPHKLIQIGYALAVGLLYIIVILPQQALPLKHPIRAYVAQDRLDRKQAHKRLHPQQLLSEGAVPLLPFANLAAAKHDTRASGSSSSSSGTTSSTDAECAGGSNPRQLLFCSKHWLLQLDPKTGGMLTWFTVHTSDLCVGRGCR
jgi:hypothetical protein